MKVYIQEYEIGKPGVQKITVPEQSDIKLRFKLKGEDVTSITSESLSEITIKDGYGECKLNTGLPRTENINVVINDKSFKMIMVVVESDVYEQTDDVKLPEIKDNSKEVEELKTRTSSFETTRSFVGLNGLTGRLGLMASQKFSQPVVRQNDGYYIDGDFSDNYYSFNGAWGYVADPLDTHINRTNANGDEGNYDYVKMYNNNWGPITTEFGESPIKNCGITIYGNNSFDVNFKNLTDDEDGNKYYGYSGGIIPTIKFPNSLVEIGGAVEYPLAAKSQIDAVYGERAFVYLNHDDNYKQFLKGCERTNLKPIFPFYNDSEGKSTLGLIVQDGYAVAPLFDEKLNFIYDAYPSNNKCKIENLRGIMSNAFNVNRMPNTLTPCTEFEFNNVKRFGNNLFSYSDEWEIGIDKITIDGDIEYIGENVFSGRTTEVEFKGKGFLNAFVVPMNVIPKFKFSDITKNEFKEWMLKTVKAYYDICTAFNHTMGLQTYKYAIDECLNNNTYGELYKCIFNGYKPNYFEGEWEYSLEMAGVGKFIFADGVVEINSEPDLTQWDN
jgi:hypothetical protein